MKNSIKINKNLCNKTDVWKKNGDEWDRQAIKCNASYQDWKHSFIRLATISSESFILVYGIWTIASHLAVVGQLPFHALSIIFPLLFASSILVLWKLDFFTFWNSKSEYYTSEENSAWYVDAAFIGLVLFMLFVALFAHKPDFDDAHYIRTSVDMVDHPEKPLLLNDALGLFEGAPLLIPVYKAHSIESFCAAISSLTGIPVIYVFHFFLPVLGLFLSVMVYLLLFKVIIPQKAVLATIISFIIIYAVSLRAMGNVTFIRMHQGKGILLGFVIPFIITYGLKASQENNRRNWIILTLAQIAAIGMNATSLWLAPVIANLAVISGTLAVKPTSLLRNTVFGILSTLYIVVFGMYIVIHFQMPPFYINRGTESFRLIVGSIQRVFGDGLVMYLSLVVIFFTWLFSPSRLSRILCLVFPAFLLLFFFNPLIAKFLAKNFISEETYWRVVWLIPFQLFVGIIGISVFLKNKPKWLVFPKLAFVIGMLIIFFEASPSPTRLFAPKSAVEIKLPSLKVTNEYYVAEQINQLLSTNDVLISPNNVSIWISTMHHHPSTLIYRVNFDIGTLNRYIDILEKNEEDAMGKFIKWTHWYKPDNYIHPSNTLLSQKIRELQKKTGVNALQVMLDYEFKHTLKAFVSGESRPPNPQTYFSEGIIHFGVTAVCLPPKLKWKHEITDILESSGFSKITTIDNFELWKRNLSVK